MDVNIEMTELLSIIEDALDTKTRFDSDIPQAIVFDAMRYNLLGGGKRIRAILAIKFCTSLGGTLESAIPAACAIEMIHSYSLIHDDLPCMDNDDLRRGKPTCHIKYGEAIALLAGDALLNKAFEVLSDDDYIKIIGSEKAIKIIRTLSTASGNYGMIGGQTIDIQSENTTLALENLTKMHRLKTGALISAAVTLGGVLSGCNEEMLSKIYTYSQKIGLAFQITDDILDVEGNSVLLGKNIGSDRKKNKTTYVTLFGLEQAKIMTKKLFDEAKVIIRNLGLDDQFILELTDMLSKRKS